MKPCRSSVSLLVCLFLVLVSHASASITVRGELSTGDRTVQVDSVAFLLDEMRWFPSPGWSGNPAEFDTFDFLTVPYWPLEGFVIGEVDGMMTLQSLSPLLPDTWYVFGDPGPEQAELRFTQIAGVEAEHRFRPAPGLAVSASIVRTGVGVTVSGTGLVEIADAAGNTVRTLPVNGAAHWRGDDNAGRGLSAGVYFVRLVADGRAAVRKVLLAH